MGVVPRKELHAPDHEVSSTHSSEQTSVDAKSSGGSPTTKSNTSTAAASARNSAPSQQRRKSGKRFPGKNRKPAVHHDERAPRCAACHEKFQPTDRWSKYCMGAACGKAAKKRFFSPGALAKQAVARIAGRSRSPIDRKPALQQQIFSTLPWSASPAMSAGRFDDGVPRSVRRDDAETSPVQHGAYPRRQQRSRGKQRKPQGQMSQEQRSPQSSKSRASGLSGQRTQDPSPIILSLQQGSLNESSAVDAPGHTETTSGSVKTLLSAPEVLPEKFNNDDTLLVHDYQQLDSAAENSMEFSGTYGFSAGGSSAPKTPPAASPATTPDNLQASRSNKKTGSPSKCTCKKGHKHKHHHHKHHYLDRTEVITEFRTPAKVPVVPQSESAQMQQQNHHLVVEFSDTEDLFSNDPFPHLDTASKKALAHKLGIPGEEVLEVTNGDKREDRLPRHHNPSPNSRNQSRFIAMPLELLDKPEVLSWLKDRITQDSSTVGTEDAASSLDLAGRNKDETPVQLPEKCHTPAVALDGHELAQMEWRDAVHGVHLCARELRVNSGGKECARHVLIKPVKSKCKNSRRPSSKASTCSKKSGSSPKNGTGITLMDRPVAGELPRSEKIREENGFMVMPTVISQASMLVKAASPRAKNGRAEEFVREVVMAPPTNEFHALARREDYNMVSLFPEATPQDKIKSLSEHAIQTEFEQASLEQQREEQMLAEQEENARQQIMLQQWLQQKEQDMKEFYKHQLHQELEQELKKEKEVMLHELQEKLSHQKPASSARSAERSQVMCQASRDSPMRRSKLQSPPTRQCSPRKKQVAYYGERTSPSVSRSYVIAESKEVKQNSKCLSPHPPSQHQEKITEKDIAVLQELRLLLEQLHNYRNNAPTQVREAYTEVSEEVLNKPASMETYAVKARPSRDVSCQLSPRAAIVATPLNVLQSKTQGSFTGVCRRSPSRGISPVYNSLATAIRMQDTPKSTIDGSAVGSGPVSHMELTNKSQSPVAEAKTSLSRQRVFGPGPPDILEKFTAIPSAERITEVTISPQANASAVVKESISAYKQASVACSDAIMAASGAPSAAFIGTPSDTSVIEHELPRSPGSAFSDDQTPSKMQIGTGLVDNNTNGPASTTSAQTSSTLPAQKAASSAGIEMRIETAMVEKKVVAVRSAAAAVPTPNEEKQQSPWPELQTPASSAASRTSSNISASNQRSSVQGTARLLGQRLDQTCSEEQHSDAKISDFASSVERIASNPAEEVSLTENDNGSIQGSTVASPSSKEESTDSAVAALLVTEPPEQTQPAESPAANVGSGNLNDPKPEYIGEHLTSVTAATATTTLSIVEQMVEEDSNRDKVGLTTDRYNHVGVQKPVSGKSELSDFDVRSFGFEIPSPKQRSCSSAKHSKFQNSPIGVAPVRPAAHDTGIQTKTPMRTLPILTSANSLSTSETTTQQRRDKVAEQEVTRNSSARATMPDNTSMLLRSKYANLPRPPQSLNMELITSAHDEVSTWICDLHLRPGDNIVLRGKFNTPHQHTSLNKEGMNVKKADLTPKQSGMFAEGNSNLYTFGLDLWKISKNLQRHVADDSSPSDTSNTLTKDDTDEEAYSLPNNYHSVERAFFLNPIFPERKMLVGSSVKSEWRSTKYVAIGRNFVFEPDTPFEFVLYFRETNFMLKWKGVHGKGELIYAYVHPLKDISHLRVYGCDELNTALLFY